MSETDPGYSEQHAGDVGARRATVGTPTERESINVPPTRPGAAENARKAELARQAHETFIPEVPAPDDRTEMVEDRAAEERAFAERAAEERAASGRHGKGDHRGHRGHRDHEEEDEVRRNIKETRNELGDTVSALAAKTDIKSRAAEAAGAAKGKVAEATGVAKGKAAEAAGTAKGMASEVAGKVREATPDQVKDAATEARKRPVLLLAVAGAVIAVVVRRLRKRNRAK
ncbi:DUF3618 domain-containing protein [Nonomuraea sp. WAC 01424]|uniref:DUF3618 domain-containing protein n=1 Tax=Nonomuraea sp. WAC 01424 TaxID=2203200 RepID=UPI001C8B5D96|nr:DUF3618 domain-containing protein [Nonomuraea sp. WAC 01424]